MENTDPRDKRLMKKSKDWNIAKELAMDRCAWKLAIHVPEP